MFISVLLNIPEEDDYLHFVSDNTLVGTALDNGNDEVLMVKKMAQLGSQHLQWFCNVSQVLKQYAFDPN